MATGGFKPSATTDFLEEWKAKREKMRAKMLGDIAAATGRQPEPPNNGAPERSASSGNCLKRAEEEPQLCAAPGGSPRRATPDCSPAGGNDSDKESPSPGKGKEKKSAGPSARKGKGQIEKRKLREKRRSTGVVSIPSNEVSPARFCENQQELGLLQNQHQVLSTSLCFFGTMLEKCLVLHVALIHNQFLCAPMLNYVVLMVLELSHEAGPASTQTFPT